MFLTLGNLKSCMVVIHFSEHGEELQESCIRKKDYRLRSDIDPFKKKK